MMVMAKVEPVTKCGFPQLLVELFLVGEEEIIFPNPLAFNLKIMCKYLLGN